MKLWYNSIMIITDQLTKEAKFVLINKEIDIIGIVYIVLEEVIIDEGILEE